MRYANTAGPLKGLRRGSMLCEPVLSVSGNVAAVVQVVRSKDQHEAEGNVGFPQPFSTRAKHLLRLFAVLLQGHLSAAAPAALLAPPADVHRTLSLLEQAVDPIPRHARETQRALATGVANLAAAARSLCAVDAVLVHLYDDRDLTFRTVCDTTGVPDTSRTLVTSSTVGFAWRAAAEDRVVSQRVEAARNVDMSLYEELGITPACVMVCALRQAGGRLFGFLELVRVAKAPKAVRRQRPPTGDEPVARASRGHGAESSGGAREFARADERQVADECLWQSLWQSFRNVDVLVSAGVHAQCLGRQEACASATFCGDLHASVCGLCMLQYAHAHAHTLAHG